MIDRRSLMLSSLAATALAPLPAWADPTQGWVDVRQFGARGDGSAIDTPAINRAIVHAAASDAPSSPEDDSTDTD